MTGSVSPTPIRFTKGLPSVDAIEIPPVFAVVSFEISLPAPSVLTPRTRSASATCKVWVTNALEVPPIVILPLTFILRSTCKSLVIVTSWGAVNWFGILSVGVEPSPVPLVTVIWFAVPVMDLT